MLSLLSTKAKGPLLLRRRSAAAADDDDDDAKTAALNEALDILADVFPNVECDEFRRMLATLSEESRVHIITEMLLKRSKDGGVLRRRVGGGGGGGGAAAAEKIEAWERFRTEGYMEAARGLLYKEFKGLSKSTIRAVMAENNSDYFRTRTTLSEIALKSWRFSFANFFRGTRATIAPEPPTAPTGNPELDAELLALSAPSREKQIAADRTIAQLLNEAEHAAASELVECECCYGDYAWDEIAACSAAHFFCHGCLLKSVQEGLYGQGRNIVSEVCSVRCLSSAAAPACEAFVPHDLLQAVLPPDVFQHLEDKTATDALDRCGLDLVKCPFCAYAEVLPPSSYRLKRSAAAAAFMFVALVAAVVPLALGAVLFLVASALFTLAVRPLFPSGAAASMGGWLAALSPRARVERVARRLQRRRRGMLFRCAGRCRRESCVECSREWAPFHRCYEKEEDGVRIFVERAMADAVKRTCPLCSVSFVKSDGCNKLTCPCGYVMCYVCRADIHTEGYKHFCQHFRQVPGTTCDECESCDLYVQEDEAAVIKKAAERAEKEYFRRFKKPEGWVYRRMENSVLGTELDMAETSWLDVLDGQLEKFLERVLE